MTTEPTQLGLFRAIPRAIQWALLAAVAIVLFLLWDSWLKPWTDDVAKAANGIESRVADIRLAREVVSGLQSLKHEVVGIGQVDVPKKQAEGAEALQELVNDVLKRHAVTNQKYESRTRGKLPSGTLTNVTQGKRLDRQTGDLTFVASADDAAAIIAELESSPVVYAITSVRITREQSATRKIKVAMSLESWVISNDTPTKGGKA